MLQFLPQIYMIKKIRERAKSLQSCLTLCNLIVCSPPASSVHGILQARMLEWVAVPSSSGSYEPRDRTCLSNVSCIAGRFFTTSTTWQVKVHESEQTLGGGDWQGSVVCFSSWGCKELDMKLRTKQQSFPSIILGILHILSHTSLTTAPHEISTITVQ